MKSIHAATRDAITGLRFAIDDLLELRAKQNQEERAKHANHGPDCMVLKHLDRVERTLKQNIEWIKSADKKLTDTETTVLLLARLSAIKDQLDGAIAFMARLEDQQ